jgi:O-acetyl-ADP-ribose deacetylase (regulator of RNase III)
MSAILSEIGFSSGPALQLAQGDITLEPVDAIVNAANERLQHGGGVAWAIVRRGGESIQRESDEWIAAHGAISHTRPAYTRGGDLPCKYVIHAVGPVWGDGDEDTKLADAVTGALSLADQLGLASIAFPAISTGIFGFPKDRAARVMLLTMRAYINAHPNSSLKLIRIVLFDQPTVAAFVQEWKSENKK